MQDDDDQALVTAYVAGELDEAARFACEQRLARDPAFAQRLLAFESVDLIADFVRPTAAAAAPPRRWRVGPLLAAVAVAATAAVLVLWQAPRPAIPCVVRVVASHGGHDLDTYAAAIGLPAEVRYASELRSAQPAAGLAAEPFLAAVAAREGERTAASFAAPQQPVVEAFFTLRLRVEQPCHALVLQADTKGRWWRRFPALTPVFGELPNPLPAGTHTLPRPVVLLNPIGTLSLHAGFAGPSDTTRSRPLVLALTGTAIPAADWAELDRLLAQAQPASDVDPALPSAVVHWLADHDCTPHSLATARS